MLVSLQLVGVANMPSTVTVLMPWVAPKLVPVIVTNVPTGPELGESPVMLGVTVKPTPLLDKPSTVTTTVPVVAPAGSGVTIAVVLQFVGVAAIPLKVTVLVPCAAPKLVPVIVTEVPTGPEVGERLVILGITAKLIPLLARPPTVTTTGPGVAPAGTGVTIAVVLQLVGVAAIPLKATVFVPCVAPKFVPVIVTEVPTGPEVGDKLVILGAVTVKLTPLLARPPTVTTTFPVAAPKGTGATIFVAAQLVAVAAMPLKLTVLVPWVAPKLVPVIVTEVPTGPEVGDKLVMIGAVTVKLTPLLARPPTVTTTFPVAAPKGTGATIFVAAQLVAVAAMPLKLTVLVPWVAPKLVPVIVTEVPTGPEVGDKLVILGAVTVKLTPLLARPPTVTTTFPVAAPKGTGATIFVAAQLVAVAAMPLKLTVLVPWVAPKLVPVIVTEVPTGPEVGDKLVILGAVTVKLTPLLARPPTVTTTFPVAAPKGTGATIFVAAQLVAVAAMPLKLTVLVPWVAPKLVPVIVTEVPTGPEVGDKLVILGAVTVKLTPLLARPPTVTTTFPVAAPKGTGATIFVAAQLVAVAAMPLKLTVLVPWVAPKLVPAIVTEVPTGPEVGDKLVIAGAVVTVKLTPLLARPPTVTTTFPVAAPKGTGATTLLLLQLVALAAVPLKVTVLVPCVAPKLVPVIVTDVPIGPEVGDKLVIAGAVVTVKLTPLLARPPTVTTTFPVAAPKGTGATIFVAAQLVAVAAVPLKVTVLVPCVAPKLVPVIVTDVPTGPEVGDKLVIAGAVVTVKLTPLLARPPTVTTTLPVAAPEGTAATTLLLLQLVALAAVPLKVTVLVPCVAPKLVPVIVTDVPTGPEVGDKLVIVGAVVTVKLTPLLARPPTVTTTLPVAAPEGTAATTLLLLQLVALAAVPLKVTVLVPCVAPKLVPVIVTDVPIGPEVGDKLVIAGAVVTVKLTPLLARPPTVTTTLPVAAPEGTAATTLLLLQLVGLAAVPLKVTVLVPCVAPKLVPVIVTDVPIGPEVGDKLVIAGAVVTVKLTPLLARPPTVTTTLPVAAPEGTAATTLLLLQLVGLAAVPLKVTVLVPCVAPKLVPVIVTDVPIGPEVGDKLVIAGAVVTVKLTPLLARPPTVTTTLPVAAPEGTAATTLLLLQLVGLAAVPLKVTVLVPCVAPKLVPVIVTDVPIGPEVGDKLVIVGAVVTVKLTPLLARPPTVTTTLPVAAPKGTAATTLLLLQLVGLAAVPLKVTVLVPCVAPKLVPVIVTDVPIGPEVGDKLVIAGAVVTVKLTPLLARPPTVTTTFPVAAPKGTGATIFVAAQLVAVAAVPLKLTVLVPWVAPKLVPVIVTDVPIGPEVGDKLVILGFAGPALEALNAAMSAIQLREGVSVQVTAIAPAVAWVSSSSA